MCEALNRRFRTARCALTSDCYSRLEIEGETLPPAVSELVVKIIGSLQALFDTIHTNGPNAIRDTHRNETLQHLADLREFVLVNKIRTN